MSAKKSTKPDTERRAKSGLERSRSRRVDRAPVKTVPDDQSGLNSPVRMALSLLLLLQALGALIPGPLLWGVNHLNYLTGPIGLLWPLLGLVLIWSPLCGVVGGFLIERAGPELIGRNRFAFFLVPVIGGLLFWLLRCRIHFLGDGWLIGEMVNVQVPFHGYDFIDYHLHYQLNKLFGLTDEWATFRLFALTSVIAGAIYLAAVAWICRRVSSDWGERVLLYGLLLFFTPVLMFFGYVECYSFLMIFMVLYLVSLCLHYRSGMRLTVPALMLGLGLMFHLDALFIAPVFLVVLFWPAENAAPSLLKRMMQASLPVLIPLAVAIGLYFLSGYNRLYYENDFVAGRRLQRVFIWCTGVHGFFSWNHWKDLLNLHLILAGVPLAVFAAIAGRLRRAGGPQREFWIMAAGSIWLLLLTSILHMKLGIVRDWDLFAAQSAIYVMLAWLAVSHITGGKPGKRLVGMIVIVAFVFTTPWFLLNASESSSLTRFRGVITDLPRFGQAYAHEEIGKYCRKKGDVDEALLEYEVCTDIFPENARFHAVLGALQYNNDQKDIAFETFQRVLEADSTYALGLEMMARIHAERREFGEAIQYSRKLAGAPDESAQASAMHGAIATELGLLDEAMAGYQRSVRRDQSNPIIIERIGIIYLMQEKFAPAERAFREVVRVQPTNSASMMGLIMSIWQPISTNEASWTDPAVRARLNEAIRLIDRLVARGETNEDLLVWRRDIGEILQK